MKNPILIGTAQTFPSLRMGTVWCDDAGKIGLVVGEIEDGFLLQIGERVFEIVPHEVRSHFETTVECLGELTENSLEPAE